MQPQPRLARFELSKLNDAIFHLNVRTNYTKRRNFTVLVFGLNVETIIHYRNFVKLIVFILILPIRSWNIKLIALRLCLVPSPPWRRNSPSYNNILLHLALTYSTINDQQFQSNIQYVIHSSIYFQCGSVSYSTRTQGTLLAYIKLSSLQLSGRVLFHSSVYRYIYLLVCLPILPPTYT